MKNRRGMWKHINLKWWQRWIVILCVSVIVGCGIEYLNMSKIQRRVIRAGNGEQTEFVPAENVLILENEGKIILDITDTYINKFRYYYETSASTMNQLKIKALNGYGVEEEIIVTDALSKSLNYSVVNIQKLVTEIEISIPQGVEISEFTIINEVDFNGYNALFYIAICGLILFVLLFSEMICKKIEYGFLVMGSTVGILIILFQPPQCMGWDEHIHMSYAMDWFLDGQIIWDEPMNFMYTHPESFDGQYFVSREEKVMQIRYLNSADEYTYEAYEKNGTSLSQFSFFLIALVIEAGKLCGFPFYYVFLLGKIVNLCMYMAVMYFAIKLIPVGKRTLMLLGLVPTSLVLATAYSYDTIVISFVALGTALLIREYVTPNEKIKYRNILLIILCFLVASVPKMVYFPVVLSVLFLPASKFENRKVCYWLRGICAVISIVCLLWLIYIAVSGIATGDTRGGDTSVSRQLYLMMSHPKYYLKVLVNSIEATANTYVFGADSLSFMAYAGYHKWSLLISVLVLGSVFIEPRANLSPDANKLLRRYRISVVPVLLGIVALIWTALYLSFTEVGSTNIAGVQGRYYLPLFLPLAICLYSDKVKCLWDERRYTIVMNLLVLAIWAQALFTKYLAVYCC